MAVNSVAKLENIRDIATQVAGVCELERIQEQLQLATLEVQKHFDDRFHRASEGIESLVGQDLSPPRAHEDHEFAEWKELTAEVVQITSAWPGCGAIAAETQSRVVGWLQQLRGRATEWLDTLHRSSMTILEKVSSLAAVEHETPVEARQKRDWFIEACDRWKGIRMYMFL